MPSIKQPKERKKIVKAWAVINQEGIIPSNGVYQERCIYRIYNNKKSAKEGKFEMFEKQSVIPVEISYHINQ